MGLLGPETSLPPATCVNLSKCGSSNIYYIFRFSEFHPVELIAARFCLMVNHASLGMTLVILSPSFGQFHLRLCRLGMGNNRLGSALEAIYHQHGLIGAKVWP